jgi:hypothetical protein
MRKSHASMRMVAATLLAMALPCSGLHAQDRALDRPVQDFHWPRDAFCVADVDVSDNAGPDGDWGHGHAPNHDWYRLLRDRKGVSCCNGDASHGDCRPAQARQDADGQWQVYLAGRWTPVPPQAVLDPTLNRQPLHAHICAQRQTNYIYCFLPGGGGS